MARDSAPRCPLCGAEMREERGMARENLGMVERWWMCPSCLHRMVTIHRMVTTEDVCDSGAAPVPGETREDKWQTR